MFDEKISDYFEGASAKYLSAVDARPEKSNQHEIGGLVKAGFGDFLGRPEKGSVISFKARMVFVRDELDVPIICEDYVSWYDSRHAMRAPEYRLYYKSNDVTNMLSEGDFFLIGKLRNGSLLLVFAPAGSTTEFQLRVIFGVESVTDRFQAAALNTTSLALPLRLVLEDIGLTFSSDPVGDDIWLDRILARFDGVNFPSTADFSMFSRETLEENVDPKISPDDAVIKWMAHEERLFRLLERHRVKDRLIQGFGEQGDDVDAVIVGLGLHPVNQPIPEDHLTGGGHVFLVERSNRPLELILGQPAHFQHQITQVGELYIELLDRMGVLTDGHNVGYSRRIADGALDSAETAGDVVFGQLVLGIGENLIGFADFDQIAEMEISGALRHASGLLHGVSDDDDGVALAQFVNQLFNLGGGDGIERRARLVHQNDFRVNRNSAGDAQPLLLAAG